MGKIRWKLAVVLAVAAGMAATGAEAAVWNAVDVTVRDAPGDVLRSDGAGVYQANGDFSRIEDRDAADATGIQDVFMFEPWGKRSFSVQSAQVEGGSAIPCTGSGSAVAFFDRYVNQDWFNTLTALPAGSTIPLEGNIRCATKSSTYYFDYPPSYPNAGAACGSVTKLGERTYSFEMPAACLAEVRLGRTVRGSWSETTIARGVAAPFALLAVLE